MTPAGPPREGSHAPGCPGRIEVRGLRVLAIHGVLEQERHRRQLFEVDLDLEADLADAAASDDLGDTVDYGKVVERTVALVETQSFALLEHLAARVADALLGFERVVSVTVTVRKLHPPIPADLASVGVTLTRRSGA